MKNDMSRVMKNRDAISSVVMLLFALWVCYLSVGLSLWGEDGPGDGFFTFIGGVLLIFFASCLFVLSWSKLENTDTVKEPIYKTRFFTYVACLLAFCFVLKSIGFISACALFIFFICKVGEKLSLKKSLIIACVSTTGFLIVFRYLLGVPFPTGLLSVLTP